MKKNSIDDVNEAISQINKAVDERFFRNSKILSDSLQTDFLPLRLAAIKYHISESYLYKLRYQEKLTFYKLGSLTYCKSSDLEALFEPVNA